MEGEVEVVAAWGGEGFVCLSGLVCNARDLIDAFFARCEKVVVAK